MNSNHYSRKRKTFEEVKKQFENFNNGEFIVISGQYTNNKSVLTFKHKTCNNTFEGIVANILNGYKKCPYCNKYRKLTTKEFQEKCGNEYLVLDEYINNFTKVKIKHLKCNNTFEITPQGFLKKKNKCPYCSKNNKRNTDIFKYEINQLTNNEYELMSEYINNSTKVKIKHNTCNTIYDVTPSNFLLGYRCPVCSKKKQTMTNEEFLTKVNDLVKDTYTVLNEYKNTETKLTFKHKKCNRTFDMTPHHFLAGQRCPYCKNNYIGEERIAKWLTDRNIEFKRNFIFKDLYHKSKNHPLKFDFKLEYPDGSLLLIEFDGIQHFEESYYGDLKEYQYRDNLKNEYCKKYGHDLLRISYKEFNNIEVILNKYIK